VPPYMIDRQQPARYASCIVKSSYHIATVGSQLTDELCPSTQSAVRQLPPSTRSIFVDHGWQVYLPTRSIIASNSISRLSELRPESSHEHGLQVHTSKLARFRPPSFHDHCLHMCIPILVRSKSWSESLTSLGYGLQVYLRTPLITA
jgi:hypothetical protein